MKRQLEPGQYYEAPGEVYFVNPADWSTRHTFAPGEKLLLVERATHNRQWYAYAKCLFAGQLVNIQESRLLNEEQMNLRAASLAKKEK